MSEIYNLDLPEYSQLPTDTDLFATVAFHGLLTIDSLRTASHNPRRQAANHEFLTSYIAHLADPNYKMPIDEGRQLSRRIGRFDVDASQLLIQAAAATLDYFDALKGQKP
ncbi:MAG: hypothetical protein ACREGF_04210 [Candidatus Saccharimonadales bacterium]